MTNPFEDPDSTYVVLVNDLGRHSLWPESLRAPAGWQRSHGPDTRDGCLDHINDSWTDLS
ncbi:MbtH family protein [Nonomuraea sp. NBC_01738]|uniref:MbtH family protein n=1 Tax=Nonomuraea sp. NBC_01738 TaxID=2976003 RepID=UPI002E0E77B7|nr:MbtH family protein [Nonomuraea sp. NBC_01738]